MTPHKCPVCDGNGERKKSKRPCHACKQTGIVWEGTPAEPAPVYVPVYRYVYPYHPVSPYWYYQPCGTYVTGTTFTAGDSLGNVCTSNIYLDAATSGTTTDLSCGIYTAS